LWVSQPSQLDGTASAAGIRLSEADLREINAIVAPAMLMRGPHPKGA
jgi:hypothetical protein